MAVPVMRAIHQLYQAPLHLITTQYCGAAVPLLQKLSGLFERIGICTSYQPTGTEPGLQPWSVPIPPGIMDGGHRDILHLGMRRHPLPHESIPESIGANYGLKPKAGPFLPRIEPVKGGPVIVHSPVGDAWANAVLRELLDQLKGREVLLIGQVKEYELYRSMRLHENEGVTLREVTTLLEIWELMQGASGFVGVASAPAVIAAGSGLPSRWVIRPGGDERCVPRGCPVTVAKVTV